MGDGPFAVTIVLDIQSCGELIEWQYGGSLVKDTDYVVIDEGLQVHVIGLLCSSYEGSIEVSAFIGETQYCDTFVLEFGEPPSLDYWIADDYVYDESTVSIDFYDATGPNAGVVTGPFDVIQTAGATITVLPYVVDNGGNSFTLWFDLTDPGELPGTAFFVAIYDYTLYGLPMEFNYF